MSSFTLLIQPIVSNQNNSTPKDRAYEHYTPIIVFTSFTLLPPCKISSGQRGQRDKSCPSTEVTGNDLPSNSKQDTNRFSRIGGNPDGAISCQVTGTQHCHAKQPFIPSIIPSVRHQGGVGGIPDGGNCPLFDMMSKQGESQRDNVKGKGRTQHNMKDNICCGLRFSFCH